ncbi:hypothetical protein F4774DRAFT_377920 [Daldinia eschscholtzii]|nr:hypothetical protein F4774DRAFT_377920 [Daldinia eschscholtzii]
MAQEDLLDPAYAWEWTENQHRCSRRRFSSAEELRADIQGQGEAPQGPEPRRRLLVLHRLSVDYTRTLTDLLDIDAGFIDAHIGRLGYRPLIRRRRVDGATTRSKFACFEYPELFSVPKGLPADVKKALLARSARAKGDDTTGEPPLYAISDEKVVIFRRASLWRCARADVLLLDRPIDDEAPSFESLLYRSLSEEWNGDPNNDLDIRALVQDLVVNQWSGFFDAVTSNIFSSAHQTTALYWQAQESLERNLNSAELDERLFETSGTTYSSKSDWESLLSRLNRRVTLLSHLAPISTQIPNSNTSDISSSPLEKQPLSTRGIPPTELIPRRHRTTRSGRSSGNGTAAADDQNKHALDRVSYMGGVLLPLSIVSSILSMSDPFGPTGPMFYVFWAVAVPLVFVAVLVIYADSIRKAEVWIEVASNGNSNSNNNTSTSTTEEKPERDLEGQSDPYVAGFRLTALGKGNDDEGEEEGEEEEVGSDSFDEPVMMVEKLFKDAGSRRWQKEQLGWGGACKTALRIYKLKKGRPPTWIRHGRTA